MTGDFVTPPGCTMFTPLGRAFHEIHGDGSFGPVYFIRYNRHAGFDESNTLYPFYRSGSDRGFVEACETLLNDKLMTPGWREEDRAEAGLYTVPFDGKEPKGEPDARAGHGRSRRIRRR